MSKILDFVAEHSIHTVLFDAAGTLYDDQGPFDGVVDAFLQLQSQGVRVCLATNNTTTSIPGIRKYMLNFGMDIDEDLILSSGLVLRDVPRLTEKIKNRSCFVIGSEGSKDYVTLAQGTITDSLHEADCVVFASSFPKDNEVWIQGVFEEWKQRSTLELICINPDRYVRHHKSLYPVIGYYVDQFIELSQAPVQFYGKPDRSFSEMIHVNLDRLAVPVDEGVLFCDDNPHNIIQMKSDLPIRTAHLSQSGLDISIERSLLDEQWPSLI